MQIDTGDIFVASPEMNDRYFNNAVILIAAMDNNTVAGFILNRPTTMPAGELFDNLDDYYKRLRRRMFVGGPVDETSLHLVALGHSGGKEIIPGLRMGGRWNTIEEMLSSDEYENRLFLGYCGWTVEQLRGEISNGNWLVFKSDSMTEIFNEIDNGNMPTSQSAIAILNEFTNT
ncbi:MAG: YqgE/AlgH family protein [Chitinivibrionia bacterium]|nr:YqgE/AlgH family protein [Chitinivibrionia bacterium]